MPFIFSIGAIHLKPPQKLDSPFGHPIQGLILSTCLLRPSGGWIDIDVFLCVLDCMSCSFFRDVPSESTLDFRGFLLTASVK